MSENEVTVDMLKAAGPLSKAADVRIHWNGAQFLVVWSDSRDGQADIRGVRLDAERARAGGEQRERERGESEPPRREDGHGRLTEGEWAHDASRTERDATGSRGGACVSVLSH